MSKDTLIKKITGIIADNLGISEAEVSPSSSFMDDLNADSLDVVEMVIAMEKEFDLTIPEDDAEKITTVQDVVDFVWAHVA